MILVETVGVGQDELEITHTAHTTLVVMAPGMGDEVQAIKAGILECADVFAVNKADREGADSTVRDLELMISLGNECDPRAVEHARPRDARAAPTAFVQGGRRRHGRGRALDAANPEVRRLSRRRRRRIS